MNSFSRNRLLSPAWAFPILVLVLAMFSVGCQGETPQATLDYAPENVEKIRELQELDFPSDDDSTKEVGEEDGEETEQEDTEAESEDSDE